MKTLRTILVTVLALTLWSSSAWGQSEADKTTARQLAVEAQSALDAGKHQEAADKFARAELLFHAPPLLVGLGRAYVGLGKYVEAMESFNKVIRERMPESAPEAYLQAQEDARREIEGLDQKIAWVTIAVQGPKEPVVTIDGAEVSVASLGVKRAVNPGSHEVRASADGFKASSETFSIESAQSKEVTLTLEEDPEGIADVVPGPGPGDTGGDEGGSSIMPILGWTAIGVGGAALILGGVMGGLALGKHGDLSDACPNDACPTEEQDNLDSFRTFGTVSTVGFIVGGVLAAGGVVLLLTAPSDDDGDAAGDTSLSVGLGHASATIRF